MCFFRSYDLLDLSTISLSGNKTHAPKEERKNGVRNMSHEKEKTTSPKKDKVYWKTQTDGVIR